jgi:hypothetical protein
MSGKGDEPRIDDDLAESDLENIAGGGGLPGVHPTIEDAPHYQFPPDPMPMPKPMPS